MKKPQLIFVVATVSMMLLLAVSFLTFTGIMNSHVNSDIEERLKESVEPNLVSFNLQMEEQIKKVNTFAEFLGENWDLGEGVHTSLLRAAVDNNGLLRCAIAYPDGSFITHDSKNDGDVSKDAFFVANMKGDFFITDPRPAVVDPTKRVILFAAPVYSREKKIIGSAIYSYLCDDMNKIFNLTSMGGAMNMVVTKRDGQILIGQSAFSKESDNLLVSLKEQCTHREHTEEECANLVNDNGTFRISSTGKGGTLYVRYDKLGYNDWYMVATISEKKAAASMSYATQKQRELSIFIAVIIFAYMAVLLVIWRFQRKMVDQDSGAMTMFAFKKNAKTVFKNRTDEQFVVVKLDVKDFKLINRIYSFSTGDKVIKSISQALAVVLNNERSIFARVGVDVFILLLPYNGAEDLQAKRQMFINHFQKLMDDSFSTKVMFPTGQYVLKPSDFPKPDMGEILEKVNFAHRAAKKNCDVIVDYEDDIEQVALFEKRVEDRMEDAIKSEEFSLYLQPKIRLSDEKICGAEALVRWKIGDQYYMYPTDFIPILEKNGFIVQVDKYMFGCAAKYIRQCLDDGIEPIPISINFSRHHLNNNDLVEELCEIADRYQISRSYLEVELTESAYMGNTQDITHFINHLHEKGFLISMDDFGSGYSCFAQLKDLQIDILKIDKGFFDTNQNDDRAEVVIAGIIKIAKDLHITTVAEGIETREQVEMLKTLGCDIIQGYYYARPMPADKLDIQNFKAYGAVTE